MRRLLAPVAMLAALGCSGGRSGVVVQEPSFSMYPTLHQGQRVTAEPGQPVVRGSIILFRSPPAWDVAGPNARYIFRVIAVGGDHLVCCSPAHALILNGRPLHEPYLFQGNAGSGFPFDVHVLPGQMFVMGDDRSHAADSRAHISDGSSGGVPLEFVVGVIHP